MTEEEKKAYNYLKKSTDGFLNSWNVAIKSDNFKKYDYMQLRILLNLIDKQQKEIKELKEKNNQLINYLYDSYYVSADKIREKIKDLKNIIEFEKPTYENYLEYTIDILKELLEEN